MTTVGGEVAATVCPALLGSEISNERRAKEQLAAELLNSRKND